MIEPEPLLVPPLAEAASPVDGLWLEPPDAWTCLVLAHGAGAGMDHPGMAGLAEGLATRGVATLRFQFPFVQRGSRRVDPPAVAQATVRAAVAEAGRRWPRGSLFAGGRSFGGRMTSQAQAAEALPRVAGLVFFAFPLHPAGKPAVERAAHLGAVSRPMLFVQGTRDALADASLLAGVLAGLGPRATLVSLPDGDHSLLRRGGKAAAATALAAALDAAADWMRARLA